MIFFSTALGDLSFLGAPSSLYATSIYRVPISSMLHRHMGSRNMGSSPWAWPASDAHPITKAPEAFMRMSLVCLPLFCTG